MACDLRGLYFQPNVDKRVRPGTPRRSLRSPEMTEVLTMSARYMSCSQMSKASCVRGGKASSVLTQRKRGIERETKEKKENKESSRENKKD